MAKRVYSLRVALVFCVALPATFVLAGTGWLGVHLLARDAERRLQEDIELVARALQGPVSWAIERGGGEAVESALESALDIGRVYGVYIYDVSGKLLASAGDIDPRGQRSEVEDVSGGKDHQVGKYEKMRGRRVYSFFLALRDSDGIINGVLQLTRRQRDMDEALASLWWLSAFALFGGVFSAMMLALWGHRRTITRHIDRLVRDVELVGGGHRSHRIQVTGPREIGTLADAINQMLENIEIAECEIEHRRRTEMALVHRLKRSEKMAAIGELGAGVAHELGSPLSTVDGHAQRALRRSDLSRAQREVFQGIRRETERMAAIVRQILEFGRNQPRAAVSTEIGSIARDAVGTVGDGAAEVGVVIALVGDQANTARACVDPGRIRQALVNLLHNAIKAAAGRVEIAVRHSDGWIYCTVDDDGAGIDPSMVEKVFEPFFTTKPAGEGTGLGLAIVHGVAEEHAGTVEASVSPLGGARFTLSFPCSGLSTGEKLGGNAEAGRG